MAGRSASLWAWRVADLRLWVAVPPMLPALLDLTMADVFW